MSPATLEAKASIKTADSASIADDVADWWTENLRRELWADTWVARVPGEGIQWIEVPRWPIWENPPVVTPISVLEIEQATFDILDYRVTGQCRQLLYRPLGWPWTAPLVGTFVNRGASGIEHHSLQIGPDPEDALVIGFRAGFVMPGEVLTWADDVVWTPEASTSYDNGTAVGWARATDRTVQGLFEVTAGSGVEATEPTWPTVDGESFVGANATFTLRLYAEELPRVYVTASIKLARALQKVTAGGKCPGDKEAAKIMKMVMRAC